MELSSLMAASGVTATARHVRLDPTTGNRLHAYELTLENATGVRAVLPFWCVPEGHERAQTGEIDGGVGGLFGMLQEAVGVLEAKGDLDTWLAGYGVNRTHMAPEIFTPYMRMWDRIEPQTKALVEVIGSKDAVRRWAGAVAA